MFQFPRLPSRTYRLGPGFPIMTSGGLPHSGASGSLPACGSPELFAACHALHRPLPPRHPPRALSSLITPDLTALDPTENTNQKPEPTTRVPAPGAARRRFRLATSRRLHANLRQRRSSAAPAPAQRASSATCLSSLSFTSMRLSRFTSRRRDHSRQHGQESLYTHHRCAVNQIEHTDERCPGKGDPVAAASQPLMPYSSFRNSSTSSRVRLRM